MGGKYFHLVHFETGSRISALEGKPDSQLKSSLLIHASLAKSTWGKYASGWKAFDDFQFFVKKRFSWPLSNDTVRGFAIFCLTEKNLQPSSVKGYISAVSLLQKLQGFKALDTNDDILTMILRGASNLAQSSSSQPHNSRRVMTLPLLRIFGNRLSISDWDCLTSQCLWTAGVLAFFGTIRMGELLAPGESFFDPTATLIWDDIVFREEDDSFIIHLRLPKTHIKEGEFVDIFKFPHFGCCPVAALKKLKRLEKESGFGNPFDPVFVLPSGKFLTKAIFNSALKSLLGDICDYKVNSILCHSFRAGIPSQLARFPELMSSDDVKGWGRWTSDAYDKYTRLKIDQKKGIYDKIMKVLL